MDNLLPYKSGFTISQVLADPYYIQTKAHLLKLSNVPKYMHELIVHIYNLLLKILENEATGTLHDKSSRILNSIYVVILLLSNFLDSLKSTDNHLPVNGEIFRNAGLKNTGSASGVQMKLDDQLLSKLLKLLLDFTTNMTSLTALFKITSPRIISNSQNAQSTSFSYPEPTNHETSTFTSSVLNPIKKGLLLSTPNSNSNSDSNSASNSNTPVPGNSGSNFLPLTSSITNSNQSINSSIISTNSNDSATATSLRSYEFNNNINYQDYYNTMSSDHDHIEVKKLLNDSLNINNFDLINLIDKTVSSVFFSIASTNQTQYLNFNRSIFKHFNADSLFVKQCHVIQFSFICSSNFNSYVNLICDILYNTARNSQKYLLLHFFSKSLLSWALYRTEDFLKSFEKPLCSKNAEVLFDTIYRNMDIKYSPKIYYSILSCLLFLQPKQLIKFINEKSKNSASHLIKRSITNAAKLNSNKQKFLNDFTNLVIKSPEYAQPLISFLLIGSSVGTFDKYHPLYQFASFMIDPLMKQLNLDNIATLQLISGHSLCSLRSDNSKFFPLFNYHKSDPITLASTINLLNSHNRNPEAKMLDTMHQLRIGVFAISSVVETSTLKEKVSIILNSNKNTLQLLLLFTGSLRLLILIPSLADEVVKIIQDVSTILLKILSLLCDNLTNNSSVEEYGDDDDQLNSINLSPPLASQTSSINLKFKNASLDLSESNSASDISVSTPVKNFDRSSNRYKRNDDKSSDRSVGSKQSFEPDDLPLYKISIHKPIFANVTINPVSIKSQILKSDTNIIKENIINILKVYSSFPYLCYPSVTSNKKDSEPNFQKFEKIFKRFIDKVISLLYLEDDDISQAVELFLLSFCSTVANNDPLKVFAAYIGTSILIDSVSAVGISSNIKNEKRDKIIKLILKLLEKRAEFSDLNLMYINKHIIDSVHGSKSCGKIIANFEKVCFLGLFTSNIETMKISKRLLQFYVFVITNKHHSEDCFDVSNLKLAQSILADKMTFGIVSIRKKIRDHLCHLKSPTNTLLSIWSLMYERVAIAYNYENGPTIKSNAETINKFFENHKIIEDIEVYSEYLASLGGIIMSKGFETDLRQPFFRKNLETFISNKFISLFSKDVKKREHSREILSVSIHPYLCGIFLNQIRIILPRFESSLKSNEFNVCELFLSVIRSICHIESESLFYYATELWDINFTLLKMFNIENFTPEFFRLKLKFCKLQVLFLSKLDELSLNGNILMKNKYARIAVNYLENSFENNTQKNKSGKVLSFNTPKSSTSLKSLNNSYSNHKKMSSKLQEFKESELKDLQMDIRFETSIMLKMIFYKLPLDTPRHDYAGSDDDKSAATVVFSNYFNLFVRLLENLDEMKNDKNTYFAMTHRSSNIIKEAIQALINLLNANSHIGLRYSLSLGFHDNELIRVSFIDVFSKIIKDIHSSNEKILSGSEVYQHGLSLLINDTDLFLAAASCCPKSEIEPYASSILHLGIKNSKRAELFLGLIKYDILHTSDKNEILRSNTVGTRVTALYSYDSASNYLISIFRPIFTEMVEKEEFFEIEKVSNESDEEKERNLNLFIKYLNLIAVSLSNSLDKLPICVKLITKTIFDTTNLVLPEIKYSAISAFLFLRLINPTIVSPERLHIVEYSSPRFKRSLIQLARVIQTIVNEAPIRLPLLESRQHEISAIKEKIFSFMKQIVDFNLDETLNNIDYETACTSRYDASNHENENENERNQRCALFLHGFFYNNWMNIRHAYYTQSFGGDITQEEKTEVIRKMDNLLANCGLPKRISGYEIPENVRNDKSPKGILLYDFMSRTELALADLTFIKVLITKDGLPLICINTLEFPSDITSEQYVFNLLQTMAKFWDTPFCCLCDLTGCGNFGIFREGRELMYSIIPSAYKVNCKRIYYVNMPVRVFAAFKKFDIYFMSEEKDINTDFIFVSTNDDAKTMNKNKLIGYVNPVSHDARVTFHDVSIFQEESNRFVPIKLKIGNQFLQIYSAMPQRIKLGDKMHIVSLVDCFKISELSEIAPTSFTGVANEISMIDSNTNKRIILTSTKKIEIMRTLYFSRAKLNNNVYSEEDDYGSDPTSTVGHLLNVSFSGLLSESDEIRKSSYALLSSIKQSAGLKTVKSIDSIEGVVFPYGNIDYISSVSANIAKNHPDLTYSFMSGFFNAFEKLNDSDRNSMVLFMSSWVKNIYKYVYLSDTLLGHGRTCDIIRKCVKASSMQNCFQVFSLYIWPQLSLEDGLIEIVIDEIVSASIDHEAEGNDWHRITKYWPLRSSIEICSVIIKRMKEKSYIMPLNEGEIEAHTRWIETTVLARFLAFLIFDSLLFVDRYISDIFYIVTIYMDYGPLELRTCLLNLLTRAFHAYLSKPSLTKERYVIIKNEIELINGPRFRMLFGLTREDNDEIYGSFKIIGSEISNKANAVSTLCELLTSFLENDSGHEEYLLQIIKWNANVSKIAFDSNSQLQSRAILILGSLTKQGISDELILKLINLLRINSKKYVESKPEDMASNINLIICTLHSFGKSIMGIDSNSIFHPMMFWTYINILLCDNIGFFKYGIEFLEVSMTNVHLYAKENNIGVVDCLFQHKDDLFSLTEQLYDFKFTRENFDVILALLCCKGLESPFTFSESVETIKALLKIRYDEHLSYPDDNNNEYVCYILLIYLTAVSDDEMVKAFEDCGIANMEYLPGTMDFKIPAVLSEWFELSTLNVYSICLGITNYFVKQKIDELTITKVIALYFEMFQRNSGLIPKLFSKLNEVLKKFVSSVGSATLLEKVLDMIVALMNDSQYIDHEAVESAWLEKFENGNTRGVTDFTFSTSKIFVDAAMAVPQDTKRQRLGNIDRLLSRSYDVYKEKRGFDI